MSNNHKKTGSASQTHRMPRIPTSADWVICLRNCTIEEMRYTTLIGGRFDGERLIVSESDNRIILSPSTQIGDPVCDVLYVRCSDGRFHHAPQFDPGKEGSW